MVFFSCRAQFKLEWAFSWHSINFACSSLQFSMRHSWLSRNSLLYVFGCAWLCVSLCVMCMRLSHQVLVVCWNKCDFRSNYFAAVFFLPFAIGVLWCLSSPLSPLNAVCPSAHDNSVIRQISSWYGSLTESVHLAQNKHISTRKKTTALLCQYN